MRREAAALALALLSACAPASRAAAPGAGLAALEAELRTMIRAAAADSARVSVAFCDLATGDSLLLDAHLRMHAASTMKVPVMLELFRRADRGELSLDDSVAVRNAFASIADGSAYSLTPAEDSDSALYLRVGGRATVRELVDRMITRSSNLATNLVIDLAEPRRIAATLRELGAADMHVLRGVEDIPAYRAGMNNTTTAYGFMKVLEAVASGRGASPAATREMVAILQRQAFREMIPAGLPPGTPVANKTGWITGIDHDGAIVYPPGRAPYVLVVLTRGFTDRAAARRLAADLSRAVYRHATAARRGNISPPRW
ncbi:MAG TPA: serine hydrolase [Longimicrobiaceae bacterium]|nr:serine hydrolase [Longimicrobiaceae bacterium]